MVSESELFPRPGSLIVSSNLRVLFFFNVKWLLLLFFFFGFGLSRTSANRLVVGCSEQCLADDAPPPLSRSGMPLLLLPISLLLLLSFLFLFTSFLSYGPDSLSSVLLFSVVCGVACSLEMQAG